MSVAASSRRNYLAYSPSPYVLPQETLYQIADTALQEMLAQRDQIKLHCSANLRENPLQFPHVRDPLRGENIVLIFRIKEMIKNLLWEPANEAESLNHKISSCSNSMHSCVSNSPFSASFAFPSKENLKNSVFLWFSQQLKFRMLKSIKEIKIPEKQPPSLDEKALIYKENLDYSLLTFSPFTKFEILYTKNLLLKLKGQPSRFNDYAIRESTLSIRGELRKFKNFIQSSKKPLSLSSSMFPLIEAVLENSIHLSQELKARKNSQLQTLKMA
jgi:hypothetical protein